MYVSSRSVLDPSFFLHFINDLPRNILESVVNINTEDNAAIIKDISIHSIGFKSNYNKLVRISSSTPLPTLVFTSPMTTVISGDFWVWPNIE